MNKKLFVMAAMTTLTLAVSATASAGLERDFHGQLHFIQNTKAQTIMKAEDMHSSYFWIRPQSEISKTTFAATPVNKILEISDKEMLTFTNTESNLLPAHTKSSKIVIPTTEVLNLVDEEFDHFSNTESNQLPSRIIKPMLGGCVE